MTARAPGRVRPGKTPIALDWVRWGLVVFPVLTALPLRNPGEWVLIAVTVVAAIPLLWLPPAPGWLLPTTMALVVSATGTLWILAPDSWVATAMFSTTFYAARTLSRVQSSSSRSWPRRPSRCGCPRTRCDG